MTYLVIAVANALLKLAVGWATFTFVTWMGWPLWLAVTLTVMAVGSTWVKYQETRG